MVHFVYKNEVHYNNTVDLEGGTGYIYTTKIAAGGRWYYESTHLSGSLLHLVGFAVDKSKILAYPQGETNDLKIYYENCSLVEGYGLFTNMNFTNFDPKETIGLSFDTNTLVFSVYFGSQIRRFTLKLTGRDFKARPVARETIDKGFEDRVKFNFGQEDFANSVPSGYTPWYMNVGKDTCKQSMLGIRHLFFSFLIFSS